MHVYEKLIENRCAAFKPALYDNGNKTTIPQAMIYFESTLHVNESFTA